MNPSSFYTIGKDHTVCEDYARTGILNRYDGEIPFAIVCDGCSSSPNTDLGARFLALSFQEELQRYGSRLYKDPSPVFRTSERYVSPILDKHCLDATLWGTFISKGTFWILGQGDGGYLTRMRDTGEVHIHLFDFDVNAPPYFSYLLEPQRAKAYQEQTGNGSYTETTWLLMEECSEIVGTKKKVICDFSPWVDNPEFMVAKMFSQEMYDLVMVFSDGVQSFHDLNDPSREIDVVSEILEEFLKIKNYNGEFMVRRINRFLKDCAKRNWVHADDLGVAALYAPERGELP